MVEFHERPFYALAIRYGLLLGLCYILFELVRYVTGTHYRTTHLHLFFRGIALLFSILLMLYFYMKKDAIQLGLKRLVQIGVVLGFTAALIFITYHFILTSFIEPDYYATYSEVFRPDHARNHPQLSPEEVDADVKAGLASAWQVAIVALVSTTLTATVLTLCSYWILKKTAFLSRYRKG
ncbi:DUF4199 domain-containing protein [Spongiimicrobium salis]|uniref:DUF4199 domain-containing protein n=1 Tax=Spongiimicrobium salis TaxID=1667022 RepID=UPI00374DA834